MKKLIYIAAIVFAGAVSGQVIIGDAVGTAGTKTSVLLEFAANQNKGLILPYVRTLPSGAALTEGTIVLNATDGTRAKVQYYNGSTDWVDLSSGNEANISGILSSQPAGISENAAAKTIIGAPSSTADGVLVLESATQAMVLPTVADTNDVINPAPGLMVYINKPDAKRLAVFNGAVWTYWKP